MTDWIFALEIILAIIGIAVVSFFLLITFTTGWKKTGRLMGGLFVVVGKPGNGKTYIVTHKILEYLRDGRRVFSNFPVVSIDGKLCSRVLEEDKVLTENMNRAVIVRDEAQKIHWSRNYKRFTEEDRNFFSETGHHEISCYEITQHEMRIDTVIRDCANYYLEVEKFEIPFLEMPLFFTVTWWTSAEEMHNALYHPEIEPFDVERIWFSKDVANAYDTRFFGHDCRLPYDGKTWIQFYKEKIDDDHPDGYEWVPPKDVSMSFRIRRGLTRQKVLLQNRGIIPRLKPLNQVRNELEIQVSHASLYFEEKVHPVIRPLTCQAVYCYWKIRCFWYLNRYMKSARNVAGRITKRRQ